MPGKTDLCTESIKRHSEDFFKTLFDLLLKHFKHSRTQEEALGRTDAFFEMTAIHFATVVGLVTSESGKNNPGAGLQIISRLRWAAKQAMVKEFDKIVAESN